MRTGPTTEPEAPPGTTEDPGHKRDFGLFMLALLVLYYIIREVS